MTPEGENEQPDDDTTTEADGSARPPAHRAPAPDFGWGDPKSAQPPGPRISWRTATTSELPDRSPALSSETERSGRPEQPDDDIPPPPGAPGGRPVHVPLARPEPPAPARPAPPTTLRTPPSRPAPSLPATPPPPRSPLTPPEPPVATTLRVEESDSLRTQLRELAARERGADAPKPDEAPLPTIAFGAPDPVPAPAPAPEPAPEPTPAPEAKPPAPFASTLAAEALASEVEADRAADRAADRRAAERTTTALAELAQQLAATQTQVAAIGAQLTTLSHRISYDLERGAQTTSERILRDLAEVPDTVRKGVGADIGPALDDLTDQVETDRTAITAAVEGVQTSLAPRLAAIGEIVDALPLTNVEILSALQTLGTDLEDRLTRFTTRVGDQLTAVERANAAEVTRLRTQIDELRATVSRPAATSETVDRMAGQVERLVQKTPQADEVVEALELLVSEHLEVLRDNIDTRVSALAPAMQAELEAVRAESLAGVAATEEVLAERIEVLEATLAERMDLALADQVESVDALLTERHDALLGAVQDVAPEVDLSRVDEVAEASAGTLERVEELSTSLGGTMEKIEELSTSVTDVSGAVAELRELVAALGEAQSAAPEPSGDAAEALAGVAAELKALKRRISLRLESDDAPGGLTEEQIAVLAAHIANHLH